MKLINPTDDELNVAFAEKVAGFTDICHESGEDVDIESRQIYPWRAWRGTFEGRRRFVPPFTTSADAVLPWLEKWPYDVDFDQGEVFEYTFKVYYPVFVESSEEGSFAYNAVIALLRAHGVEVEFA
jgi:hypothetical protein